MVDSHRILYGPYNASSQASLAILALLAGTLYEVFQTNQSPFGHVALTEHVTVQLNPTQVAFLLFSLIESGRIGGNPIGLFLWTLGAFALRKHFEIASCIWLCYAIVTVGHIPNQTTAQQKHDCNQTHHSHSETAAAPRGFLARGKVLGVLVGIVAFVLVNAWKGVNRDPIEWPWLGTLCYVSGWLVSVLFHDAIATVRLGSDGKIQKRRRASQDAQTVYLVAAVALTGLWWAQMLFPDVDTFPIARELSSVGPGGGVLFGQFLVLVYSSELGVKSGLATVFAMCVLARGVGPAAAVMFWGLREEGRNDRE
ncbi:hypothetical protein HDU98_006231 [Podochytrium sp. JEL0797]|nr:hypothetical protein HDU98_006231 [Podochytrium sp. JEL0797]